MNNEGRNNAEQKHDYQINFDLIDGSGRHTPKRIFYEDNSRKKFAIDKNNPFKPGNKKKIETTKNNPFQSRKNKNNVNRPVNSQKEYVTYPVYFFKPVERDGKIWIPKPVNLEMPLLSDTEWQQPDLPMSPQTEQVSEAAPIQAEEPVQQPVVAPAPIPVNSAPQVQAMPEDTFANVPAMEPAQPKKKVNFNSSTPTYKVPDRKAGASNKPMKNIKANRAKKPGKVSLVLLVVLWVVLGLLVAFEVTSLISKPTKKDPLPMTCGYALVTQNSTSLSPTMEKGDLGVVLNADNFELNDLVVYLNDTKNVVISKYLGKDSNGNIRTRADNKSSVDKPIEQSHVKGKISLIIPQGGVFLQYFGDYVLIAVVVVLLIICYRWRSKRKHI